MSMCVVESGVLISAFRYALGRKSYVTQEIASAITANVANLTREDKQLIVTEITEAIEKDEAGMALDVELWVNCKTELVKNLAYEKNRGVSFTSNHIRTKKAKSKKRKS